MRRSRRRKNKTKGKKRALLFLLAAAAVISIAIIFYRPYRPAPAPAPARARPTPKIYYKVAIVLDDFGYNNKNVAAVLSLKRPITFSILPFQPYSQKIAEDVHQKGYEEILHLPLEPYVNDKAVKPEANTITVNMNEAEVLEKLTAALKDVPYANGISNHQGSKATESPALMSAIFTELKKRRLFFLDSLVTRKSVCKKAAANAGIGYARRSVFLDNSGDFEYIRGQMKQLIKIAKRNGSAIGIGHDREKTVQALLTLVPEAEKEGIRFVFVSELIRYDNTRD
ncbi:MAG: divergent polysaccharide deacetylase family protein [Candidatus Omnitrophica bacterium]|nr:divergent polysaccharide deacetylase family protein [Candidatus Omnitrophota bacterium]